MLKLSELKINQTAKIVSVSRDYTIIQLTELGFITDEIVQLIRIGPFGSPLCYKIGGCMLALRKEQADQINVTTSL